MTDQTPVISPQTAAEWLKSGKAVLIDVRERGEYEEERIAGAKLHPLSFLDFNAVAKDAGGKPIIFQCASGKRAANVQEMFVRTTGQTAYRMDRCLAGWRQAGLPTEKSQPMPAGAVCNLDGPERQVMIIAGVVVLLGVILAKVLSPGWIWLSATAGGLMILAGICGVCLLKQGLTRLSCRGRC